MPQHVCCAISIRIISNAMIVSTLFFFAQTFTVNYHWKSSLHVRALVTLVAAVHYMYMRKYWVQVHKHQSSTGMLTGASLLTKF